MSERDYELFWQRDGSGNAIVKGWTKGVPTENEAINQLVNVAKMPFIYKWLAAMPDMHLGMGACIGSVIPTEGAIIPSATGVDIGCGMMGVRLDLKRSELEGQEQAVYEAIKMAVPTGRSDNGGNKDVGSWYGFPHVTRLPTIVHAGWDALVEDYTEIIANDPALVKGRTKTHLGTLGTGNHFIELAEDEHGMVWVVIHSGSRGIGNKIGTHFIKLAKDLNKKWFIDLPDPNLAYLPSGTAEFNRYWRALQWAQRYAKMNRAAMMALTLDALWEMVGGVREMDRIDCHHNYAAYERHYGKKVIVTRKGAIRAEKYDRGIIPGSMGERSFIVSGKGNREAFNSASHGAGRVMSRTQAKKDISVADHQFATAGVYCDKSSAVLDESPRAYKDIEAVMAAQESLVEIEHTLKAFINVKGVSEPRRRKEK
jgi:tRNA-splicing ligase RtcB